MDFVLDDMQRRDWSQVRTIYGEGLATGIARFTTTAPKWPQWNAGHLDIARTVARGGDGRVLGWAALGPVPDT